MRILPEESVRNCAETHSGRMVRERTKGKQELAGVNLEIYPDALRFGVTAHVWVD